jgi:ribosomal protein S18 acetylase RimI-like enzyme
VSAKAPADTRRVLLLPEGVHLRARNEDDLPFLQRVYASTRSDELALTDWTAQQKSDFIAFQFRAQHQHYATHYHDGEFLVIERDGGAVGRLYLHRGSELRIVDISLLPEARGSGLGSALLRALMTQAASEGKTVSIHVERNNPALRLYLRLGFLIAGEHGIYHLMRWVGDAA